MPDRVVSEFLTVPRSLRYDFGVKAPPALRRDLDAVVVNVELTLASIVQGLALSFLAENTGAVVTSGTLTAWPYVIVGLLIILLFWTRALIHTLTLIRWPLEFVHNFFYFACGLMEVIAFLHLRDPFQWFVCNAIFALLVWTLFIHDLRIIRMRNEDSAGPTGSRLYQIVEADQRLNIRVLMPAVLVFNLAAAFAIRLHPAFFLARHGHLILVGCQIVGLSIYLTCVVRSFVGLTPLISATRAEWDDDLEHMPE